MPPSTKQLIDAFPFWGPANNGPAKNFAAPYNVIGVHIQAAVKDLPKINRVPQEIQYSNVNIPGMQMVPALVGLPQSPVQTTDQFASAGSLLSYAKMTLGSSNGTVVDKRGA